MSLFSRVKHNPTKSQSQSHSQSPQKKQRSQPVSGHPWSAHAPSSGLSQSLFPRSYHALSTTDTAAGDLFLFGGYVLTSGSVSNDLYVFSTRDFSTTLLRTSGEVPSPRMGHAAVLTSTFLLIWGGKATLQDVPNQREDDSFYLLNLGTSNLLISRPTPSDRKFFAFSIARVVPRRGQWARARRSLRPYHDDGRFQALRLRRSSHRDIF